MRRFRRTGALVFAVVSAALFATILFADRVVHAALRRHLAGRISPSELQDVLRQSTEAFVGVAFFALLLAALATVLLATLLARPLAELRNRILARARGGAEPLTEATGAEVRGVASAVELYGAEMHQRIDSLRRERDDLALLVSSVSEGILQVGPDGRIVHANPAARMLLGLPGAVRGQSLAALIRNAELRSVLERAATEGIEATCEVNVDDRRLLVAVTPLPPATAPPPSPGALAPRTAPAAPGKPSRANPAAVGAVVAFADLTEIRRLEGVRRDFVANVSHELKTPLTSIRGYVETILGDDLPPELQRQFLGVVQKNAERLHRIVDDLLDLSRLESGGWRPELQQVDPLRIADDVWTTCRDVAERRQIRYETQGQPRPVFADPAGLRQILANLLDNAVRYTNDGGRITVLFRAPGSATHDAPHSTTASEPGSMSAPEADPAGYVTIEVQDDGSGIPQDALPRIFERFYRVDPARSRADGGTGLGLAIVKHLAERMGGDVTALSELGKGTTVRLRLPAA
jgi:two-component system, OmpR family, phosphate regulon sensor histidine kinase PhoR